MPNRVEPQSGLLRPEGAGSAYAESVRLPIEQIVRYLLEVLGPALVHHLAGVSDPHAASAWANGSRRPRLHTESRLRTAYRAFQTIHLADNAFAARAWFIGLNPQLDDQAPASAIREDRLRDVVAAAEAFTRTS